MGEDVGLEHGENASKYQCGHITRTRYQLQGRKTYDQHRRTIPCACNCDRG